MADKIISWGFGILLAATVLLLGLMVYDGVTGESISLRKNEWKCTKTEQRTVMQTMVIGKVIMPMPITRSVCVEYKMVTPHGKRN